MAEDIDALIEFEMADLVDVDNAAEFVTFLFTRAGEIADDRGFEAPVSVQAIDANGDCFASLTLVPEGKDFKLTPSHEPHFPWFIVMVDSRGRTLKLRAQPDGQKIN
jgi:hypothetical protein